MASARLQRTATVEPALSLQVDGLDDGQRKELVGLCQAFHSNITLVSEEFLAVCSLVVWAWC